MRCPRLAGPRACLAAFLLTASVAGAAAAQPAPASRPAAKHPAKPAKARAPAPGRTAKAAPPSTAPAPSYRNPLAVRLPGGAPAQNCADPAVLRDPTAEPGNGGPTWYLYCTSDPVSKAERPAPGEAGRWHFHMMPIYRSNDLVHWDFVRDAFAERPSRNT